MIRLTFLVCVCACLVTLTSTAEVNCIKLGSQILEENVSPKKDDWIKGGLEAHNALRAKHGAPPLTHNPALCKSAQWTANKNLAGGGLLHTKYIDNIQDGMTCGENLRQYYNSNPVLEPAKATVDSWYDEIKNYDFNANAAKGGKVIGHFTQVVWKGSREMCMSYANSPDGTTYFIAAHYYPPGNYIGEYKENVGAPSSANKENVGAPSSASSSNASLLLLLACILAAILLILSPCRIL